MVNEIFREKCEVKNVRALLNKYEGKRIKLRYIPVQPSHTHTGYSSDEICGILSKTEEVEFALKEERWEKEGKEVRVYKKIDKSIADMQKPSLIEGPLDGMKLEKIELTVLD
jgi:hypothetical protein